MILFKSELIIIFLIVSLFEKSFSGNNNYVLYTNYVIVFKMFYFFTIILN